MPGWQEVYEKYRDKNFEVLGVSVDIQGSKVLESYTKDISYNLVVDSENVIANYYGFKIVPNGIFIDENGTISLIKQGFSINNQDHIRAIERLINSEVDQIELEDEYFKSQDSSQVEVELSRTKFKLAQEYLKSNKVDEALKELDEAILLDSDNFLIRKQRWYIRYPERFKGDIDVEWQQQQLKKEREYETKLKNNEICGPEGCIIPGTD